MLGRGLIALGGMMVLSQVMVERPWQALFALGVVVAVIGAVMVTAERDPVLRATFTVAAVPEDSAASQRAAEDDDLREADWHADMDARDRGDEKAGVAWWLS